MMFDVCRTEDGKASVGLFLEVLDQYNTLHKQSTMHLASGALQELEKTGIRRSDPRLEHMTRMLRALKPNGMAMEDLKLDVGTFKTVLSENVVLITKALQNQVIIPAFESFCDNITKIYKQVNKVG